MIAASQRQQAYAGTFLARLARDNGGNTIMMLAASLFPLLALVGGGVDMGRSYLAQNRLQQACDAGVLAARKKLGTQVVTTGVIPDDVAVVGNKFFDTNYIAGSYGSANRNFAMTLEADYSISGVASVDLPTTVMKIFGYSQVAIAVDCTARLNFSNTDIMFVLDTTGSMAETNLGDSQPRLAALKDVVKTFRSEVEGSRAPGIRVRYGFVPYSTNVNVGGLLKDEWMVTDWKYQSRESVVTGTTIGQRSYVRNWTHVSGTSGGWAVVTTYPGTYHPEERYYDPGSTTVDQNENVVVVPAGWRTREAYYSCDGGQPANNQVEKDKVMLSSTSEPFAGPPAGTRTIEHYRTTYDGTEYRTKANGATCEVQQQVDDEVTYEFDWVTEPKQTEQRAWRYAQLDHDVSDWRDESNGCIEERETYEIDDFSNVNLDRALDLDLDRVPDDADRTKWRPMYPWLIYERSMREDGTGSFTVAPVTTEENFLAPDEVGLTACPPTARKLGEMTRSEFEGYVDGLTAQGSTYHDIGMIWGGRLISPTGLFAAENADVGGQPTRRHLIFLTDGETAPLELSYSSYGVEPLDQRRWSAGSALTLTQVVEKRFLAACQEVKKRNITVWVVGFGTTLSPFLTDCAGSGHHFEASNSAELNDVFSRIASQIGDLRISK